MMISIARCKFTKFVGQTLYEQARYLSVFDTEPRELIQ